MLDRCDLSTHRECSCEPSAVPCRAQSDNTDIIRETNDDIARHGPWLLILLAVVVWAITFYAATKFGTTGI